MSLHLNQSKELINLHKELGIPSDYQEKRNLEIIPEVDIKELVVSVIDHTGRPIVLKKNASLALQKLLDASLSDNISILPFSSFRSYKYQATLIRNHLKQGRDIDEVLINIAAPGFSEHHTGCAIDVTTEGVKPLLEEFENTEAFIWLSQNASKFGFKMSYPRDNKQGFVYEPWHWFYI